MTIDIYLPLQAWDTQFHEGSPKIQPMDLLGKAIMDYYREKDPVQLSSHSSLGTTEEVPVPYFFRDFEQMPPLEQKALGYCSGKVLDIGCGVGSHSLYLQHKGAEVVGLDQSSLALEVAASRGLDKTVCSDIMDFKVGKFDTLLLLMNGVGLAGSLKGLQRLLEHLAGLLNPGGQILMDSSDLIYMFESDEDGGVWVPGEVAYYGEVTYHWEYDNLQGGTFPWLFVDYQTLESVSGPLGYRTELLELGSHFDYLARLTREGIREF
jgi:SAM-dependent methyltransferase